MTTPETAPETQTEQTDIAAQEDAKTFTEDYVRKLRAENAKLRTEGKANAEAARRLAEIEEQSKSESQKLTERIARAEAQVAEYQAKEQRSAWAAQVGQESGVPAHRLHSRVNQFSNSVFGNAQISLQR
ncbi:MAG: hypothetical protein LBR58_04790 [Propionibacteriaceae bacterium]|jgi:polyhydroxyalkanoate synthesis regulator phasin|nr:hypothetical protein [Propionibacteriaceae bacterium]